MKKFNYETSKNYKELFEKINNNCKIIGITENKLVFIEKYKKCIVIGNNDNEYGYLYPEELKDSLFFEKYCKSLNLEWVRN